MFKKIQHFISYNNLFIIAIVSCFVVGASVFAMTNDDIRDTVIGSKRVVSSGFDNTALLAVDFGQFSSEAKILKIEEDTDNYFVSYSYKSFDIVDNKWQEVVRTGKLPWKLNF